MKKTKMSKHTRLLLWGIGSGASAGSMGGGLIGTLAGGAVGVGTAEVLYRTGKRRRTRLR